MLMGYSRHTHFSSLTELMPVSIPTLICCLQATQKGEFSTITEWTSAKLIGLREIPEVAWPRPIPVSQGVFPGSKIWVQVQTLENLIYEGNRLLS